MAAAVGGAFWIAFLIGITVATLTGLAYAELVTKYPRAAGASLYANKAFGSPALTFLVTVAMMLVVVGWPAVGLFGGSPAWRRVFATAAFTVLVVGLFSLASDGDGLFTWPPFEKWNGAGGIGGTFVLGAAAGLAVSRAQERRTSGVLAPLDGWLRTARSAAMGTATSPRDGTTAPRSPGSWTPSAGPIRRPGAASRRSGPGGC